MEFYSQGKVVLVGEDGSKRPITVQRRRGLDRLPASFWLFNVSAAACCLIGCGVWCHRRGEAMGRLMAVTGATYFLSILCLSVYGTRELAINTLLFRSLSAANHMLTITWCYSLLLMLALYPKRMAGRRTIAVTYIVIIAIWLNQTLQWYEVPIHAFYSLNHLVPYAIGIVLGCLQWRATARRPVERAALRWFILSIWVSIGVAGSLFIIPSMTQYFSAVPFWMPALSILLLFVCFAFGILRYGLFNLERWWFSGWVWLASGLVITVLDALLVFILDVSLRTLLPYSILLLGWLYFPLRQWLWQRLARPGTNRLEDHLPNLIQSLSELGTVPAFIDGWSELLRRVFQPLNMHIEPGTGKELKIEQHGLEMHIPGLDQRGCLRLVGNRQGTRLFNRQDRELAGVLLDLSHAIFDITNRTRQVQQAGAAKERERIMRDLHDDVLPKLISIKQRSPNTTITHLAEAAFQSIRETIYILRYPADRLLEEALADWRAELVERLNSARLKLNWQVPPTLDGHHLTSRQFINCGRILREAVSNILRHADADKVWIRFAIDAGRLHMSISDNGQGIASNAPKGLGIRNMQLRARVLDGGITWRSNDNSDQGMRKGLTIQCSFPLG
jgi:signal transduction histidine kinase